MDNSTPQVQTIEILREMQKQTVLLERIAELLRDLNKKTSR